MQQIKSQRGAAMLFFIIFFVMASSALTFLLSRSVGTDSYLVSSLASSKQAYFTAESALEDIVLRIMRSESMGPIYVLNDGVLGSATTTVVHDLTEDIYTIRSVSQVGRTTRTGLVELSTGAGSAFNYGIQTGNGGFVISNSGSITGNAFSNGSVLGSGSSVIRGDVISAGPTGLVSGVHATGSVWTNTLDDSLVETDAYYNAVGVPSVVNGTRYTPVATTTPPESLPISDVTIDAYKQEIIDTGTIIPLSSCTAGEYLIDSDTTIGNVKIECDLRIRKTGASTVVTLTDSIWVAGNIDMEQGPILQVDPGLSKRSVQIIADNPLDRLTSSKISIRNSTEFRGSGHPSSIVMVLSQNNSSELGGTETAIDIAQSSNGDLILYAGHGKVEIGNSIYLKSVTAHLTDIGNNSDVTYDTGLTSVLFTGGPGGGYVISDWFQQ